MRFQWIVLFSLSVILFSNCSQQESADFVLYNGKIVTLEDSAPEAEAIAMKGDRILAIGSNVEIKKFISENTTSVDLKGALAIPGLIDSHAHLFNLGRARLSLDLSTAKTWAAVVEKVARAVKESEPGSWIVGRGWHQEKWDRLPDVTVEGYPVHKTLSAVSPNNPVFLKNSNGHAAFVNAKAMEVANVSATTPNPPGGQIVRNDNGQATGAMLEEGERLFYASLEAEQTQNPQAHLNKEKRAVALAAEECLSKGITSLHEAGLLWDDIDLLKDLVERGELPVRLWVMIGSDNQQLAAKAESYKLHRAGDNRLTIGGVKAYMDGALGSRGAWLLAPYSDLPESSGIPTITLDSLQKIANIAAAAGLQLGTHAIGDRGNREVLNVYEKTFQSYANAATNRWRIEHSQHLNPEDIPRFAELGVTASMQGVHCTSDGPWVPKRLGEERSESGAYVWRRLIDSGALVVNGTDAPVEDINPLENFYSSVTRKMADGTAFYPEQRMTRMEALRSYTIDGAKSVFEDDIKGSLSVGKLADITVLSNDILSVSDEELQETEVLYTIVGGKVAYQKN